MFKEKEKDRTDIVYFAVTDPGEKTAERLAGILPGPVIRKGMKEAVRKNWKRANALVFVMASGIAVRTIAPLIEAKDTDPAVIVMDIHGRHVISLLSGHLGGANALAVRLAGITGGTPVITTATDTEGLTAFDMVAGDNDMVVEHGERMKYISGALVDGRTVRLYTTLPLLGVLKGPVERADIPVRPGDVSGPFPCPGDAPTVVIDPLIAGLPGPVVYLRPRTLVLGVGCKKDIDPNRLERAFEAFCRERGVLKMCIRALATADIKSDEPAILRLAEKLGVPLKVISREAIGELDLSQVPGGAIEASDFVRSVTGVGSVSEASAYLASGKGRIRIPKTKYPGITFALAEEMKAVRI